MLGIGSRLQPDLADVACALAESAQRPIHAIDMSTVSLRDQLCADMIVKNEVHVIPRAIASLRPVISARAIVDTGSTDRTQDPIRELLADLRGN